MIVPAPKALYAVVGNPVAHSLSPAMMNALFASLDIPAVYVALQADSFEDDLGTLTRMGFSGLSVTVPHKEAAFCLADEIDETARAIGAVNTLKRTGTRWTGRNTDWIGSIRALKQVTELKGKRTLVLGAGGAARAVVFGLVKEGASVVVANRTADRGAAVATAFRCGFIPLSDLEVKPKAGRAFDIVVQCTSTGMEGDRVVSRSGCAALPSRNDRHGHRLPPPPDTFPGGCARSRLHHRERAGDAPPPGGRTTRMVAWTADPGRGRVRYEAEPYDGPRTPATGMRPSLRGRDLEEHGRTEREKN